MVVRLAFGVPLTAPRVEFRDPILRLRDRDAAVRRFLSPQALSRIAERDRLFNAFMNDRNRPWR